MISSDDHLPSDPYSFGCQRHHNQQTSHDLKIDSDDEKAHASVPDIDPLNSLIADLDDTNNPLPSFSIRDYVFNSRSKDIACNWPFSQKSLQTCLQHGVKNLLPPFQSLESLRGNQTVEKPPFDEEIVSSSDGKPKVDELLPVTSDATKSNLELTLESLTTSSSGSKGEKESQTHLKGDLAHSKSKKTPLVSSRKTESTTIQTAIKKCRGAKVNICVEPVEEVTPKNFIVSETMSSKVCPVCKTFSSSSNTTLNAHIDQCLSGGESAMKWTAKPKVTIKHRIKPRKTRVMDDIYKTAPNCTVEELDARNGTSWANNSSFPAQELEFQGEQEKEECQETRVIPEVADREGTVYVDTNGTKLRILSMPKVGGSDDSGARKLLKGGKMGKKKNKNHEDKHQQKYLKLSPDSKKFCSPKLHHGASSEVTVGPDENVAVREMCNKEVKGKEPMKPEVHTKMDDFPIVRPPWACSKRTGLIKKFSGHNARKNLSIATGKSFSQCDLRTPPSSSYSMSSYQPSQKMVTPSSSKEPSQKMGTPSSSKVQPPMSNRAMKFSLESPLGHYAKKRSPLLTKPSSKHLKKEVPLLHNSCEDASDAYPSKRFKGSNVRSNGSKLSSLGKDLLAVSREPASKINLKRKFSALKRHGVQPLSKENVVVDTSQDSLKQQFRVEEDTSRKMSSEGMNLLEVRKKEDTKICRQEKPAALRSSNGDSSAWLKIDIPDPSCDIEPVGNDTRPKSEKVRTMQVPKGIDEGSSMQLRNSLNPESPELIKEPDNVFDSQECNELSEGGRLCSSKHTQDDKEVYSVAFFMKPVHSDDVTDDIERKQNFVQKVDPKPLPVGEMVSEELQGNSSLATVSRNQSSQDQHHHDMMDQESDSPISTLSNRSLTRSDSRSSDRFFVRSASLKERGFSGAMANAINQKNSPITSSTHAFEQRSVHTVFTEKGPINVFKSEQPCCCSRKEGASSQTVASNNHESALLRKQSIESLNFRPQILAIGNNPIPQAQPPEPETDVTTLSMKLPFDSSVKLPSYSECDSAGSPSKPVLRLMGKNLTVVNTDDDVSSSPKFRPPPQISPMGQFPNVQNGYNLSSMGYHGPHPSIVSQNQNGFKSLHPSFQPPKSLRSLVDSRPSHGLETMFRSTTYVDPYDHETPPLGPKILQAKACQDQNRLDIQMVSGRNMPKTPSKPMKEIIVIDDSAEEEGNDAIHMTRNRASFPSSSTPRRNLMPSGYQSQGSAQSHSGGTSLAFGNGAFQTCWPFRDAGNLPNWNCTPAGSSSMLQASSSPSSTSRLRSSVIYYPPSFS